MSWISNVARWWRRTIVCDELTRRTFYRLLEAQLRSGIPVLGACRALAGQPGLDKSLRILGNTGADAIASGRLASEGWEASGYLPNREVGVLAIAEQAGSLANALRQLADSTQIVPTFSRDVLRPNFGQVLPFVIAMTMTIGSPFMLKRIVLDENVLTHIPLYAVATWLHDVGALVACGLVGCLFVVNTARGRWTYPKRRLLGPFGQDWLAQLAINYCRLAALLTKEGATHRQTLDAFQKAVSNPYTRKVIPLVDRDVLDGRSYASSLSGRLLSCDLAGMLDVFVPGDDRLRYPAAFESLADFQDALLRSTYSVWARGFKLLLMSCSAGLIVLLLHGLLSATRGLTQQIGVGF